ncbi:hypothetical protein TNCV_1126091, partial [Trichonephila clavipes]
PHRINLLQVPIAELAERWTELPRSRGSRLNPDHSLRVHTGYFSEYSEVYKKQSSSPVGHVLSPVLYRAPSVRINLIVCLIELCTSFELRDKFGGSAGYNYVSKRVDNSDNLRRSLGNGGAIDLPRSAWEDPLKWLKEYDRVANFNKWDDMMPALTFICCGTARQWYVNNEDALRFWEAFKNGLSDFR